MAALAVQPLLGESTDMVASLARIKSPITRAGTVAVTTGSIVTFASAIALGIIKPSQPAAYWRSVYASLLATGCGAVVGALYRGSQLQELPDASLTQSETEADQPWKAWRNFVVIRKVKESEEITSFYLKPQDGGTLPSFQPGQFLTIKLEIPGQPRPTIRTYSLSDYPDSWEYYRLSIKREPAPEGSEVPPGIASNFMHDHIQEGAVIPAKPPSGRFVLDVQQSRPIVLLSNGVGITPMLSMVKACSRLNPQRPIWFLHGARSGRYHAFREEVLAIAAQSPNLQVHYCYSRPQPEDEGWYHSSGYVDINRVQAVVLPALQHQYGSTDADYFLCGSMPFMQALQSGLKALGVPDKQVQFEAFTSERKTMPAPSSRTAFDDGGEGSEVVFARSGQTFTWKAGDGNLLDFAEANGLNPDYSCRQGICLTCMCQLQAGEVAYETPPTGQPEEGSVLICIAHPKTPTVVLDL